MSNALVISSISKFHGHILIAWTSLSLQLRTAFIFLDNGAINIRRYTEDCLAHYFAPYSKFIGDQFILIYNTTTLQITNNNSYLNRVNINFTKVV